MPFFLAWVWGYIRFFGHGYLWFRPYGESLLERAPKVTKNALPHHSTPRLGSVCPHSGIAPWARREGPWMAFRGGPMVTFGALPKVTRCKSGTISRRYRRNGYTHHS
ncbi:hypothetical protein EMIT043CA1_110026 [Pseudomonas brassicacearum]